MRKFKHQFRKVYICYYTYNLKLYNVEAVLFCVIKLFWWTHSYLFFLEIYRKYH